MRLHNKKPRNLTTNRDCYQITIYTITITASAIHTHTHTHKHADRASEYTVNTVCMLCVDIPKKIKPIGEHINVLILHKYDFM